MALISGAVVVGQGTPLQALDLAQTGHWVWSTAEQVAYHVNGASGRVDAKTQPFDDALADAQVVQGSTTGYVVTGDRVVSFGTSTLLVEQSMQAPAAEQPLALEAPGGPFLVYRSKGSVVRLDSGGLRPLSVGGPVDHAVADDTGDLWLQRGDAPQLCRLQRGASAISCDVSTPQGHAGSLTVLDGKVAWVDTTDDEVLRVVASRLGAGRPLGVDLSETARVAATSPRGTVAAVDGGRLVLTTPAGNARPVVRSLEGGPFGDPMGSRDAVVVLDRGRGELVSVTLDGREVGRTRVPADARVSRGQDGRAYVDDRQGQRTVVVDRNGTQTPVDLAKPVAPSAPALLPAPPPPVAPPPPPAQSPVAPPSTERDAEPQAPAAAAPAGPVGPAPVAAGPGRPEPAGPAETPSDPDQAPVAPAEPTPPDEVAAPGEPTVTAAVPLGTQVRIEFEVPDEGPVTGLELVLGGDASGTVELADTDRTAVFDLPCRSSATVIVRASGPGGATASAPRTGVVSCTPPGRPSVTGTAGGNGWVSATFSAVAEQGTTYDVVVDGRVLLSGAAPGRDSGRLSVSNGQHSVLIRATAADGTVEESAAATAVAEARRVNAYDNYGGGATGHAMCRGNPGDATSMPGGSASQTFSVPAGMSSVDEIMVQIDPDSRVTAQLTLQLGGQTRTANASASGDTVFRFAAVPVQSGASGRLTLSFSAIFGSIITVYSVGSPGGTLTISNSCSRPGANLTTAAGLRARVLGWND